ncbi:MAG: hypothetical protein ACTSPS_16435, partial [Promethearchaeota archaeon]
MNLKHKTWMIFAIGLIAFAYIIFLIDNYFLMMSNPLIEIVVSPIASLVTTRIFYKAQLRKLKLDDPQFNEAIKSLIQEKSELSMNDLFDLFSSGNSNEKDVEFR